MDKKYTLRFDGEYGNAFMVMGQVIEAMKEEGKTRKEIGEYKTRAMSSNYENLCKVSKEMINSLNSK